MALSVPVVHSYCQAREVRDEVVHTTAHITIQVVGSDFHGFIDKALPDRCHAVCGGVRIK